MLHVTPKCYSNVTPKNQCLQGFTKQSVTFFKNVTVVEKKIKIKNFLSGVTYVTRYTLKNFVKAYKD